MFKKVAVKSVACTNYLLVLWFTPSFGCLSPTGTDSRRTEAVQKNASCSQVPVGATTMVQQSMVTSVQSVLCLT